MKKELTTPLSHGAQAQAQGVNGEFELDASLWGLGTPAPEYYIHNYITIMSITLLYLCGVNIWKKKKILVLCRGRVTLCIETK